ncbi:RNA polymerase sigma factor [Puia dinghuensis]|uniref:RNA polymerase sigma24 factor n=1 Tax=Puia dinghuensis TaxID=1792502 RepID=A0A8J2UH58_9BACT|nr:sigma-70 family RNA polymerase sigma factor [Puia dinghuensis]GGB16907.1 RNA polymerase sigma24 factor [Puia dinghuensis]
MQSERRSDKDLWRLISQEDDRPAFEQLYRRTLHALLGAIYKWTDDAGEAEDILQEVFLDLWEKRAKIKIKNEVFSYLYSMARYKIFDRLRAKQLTEKQLRAWTLVMQEEAVATTAFVEEELANREALVSSELEQLPAQMRRVYLLSAEQGKSIREISEELLVSPYTVKNHLQKIRKRLRNAAVRLSVLFL